LTSSVIGVLRDNAGIWLELLELEIAKKGV